MRAGQVSLHDVMWSHPLSWMAQIQVKEEQLKKREAQLAAREKQLQEYEKKLMEAGHLKPKVRPGACTCAHARMRVTQRLSALRRMPVLSYTPWPFTATDAGGNIHGRLGGGHACTLRLHGPGPVCSTER